MIKFERFSNKFNQQLQFIQRSATAFDGGFEDDAIRIATSLRTIFHNTSVSTSLVEHLKLNGERMLSSARGWNDHRDFISWVLNLNSSTPVSTKPILGEQFAEVGISDWWNIEEVFVYSTRKYTRKKIILTAANKDGGAHVDEELDKFYEALSEGENGFSMDGSKLEYNGTPPFDLSTQQYAKNAHLALIRQFAHEFLAAVRHFDWTGGIEKRLQRLREKLK